MIYDPSSHEPLTATPWDPARAEQAVAALVADAEQALAGGVWPFHPRDYDEDDNGMEEFTILYLGSAGMIWALHRLGSSVDYTGVADDALRRYRERPDLGEPLPGLFLGEAGILLVAHVLGAASADRERMRELVVANEENPAWELFWGSPGTMVAARELALTDELERSGELLVAEWDRGGGIWTQTIAGRPAQYLGPAHGFVGNVHALRGLLDDDELRRRVEPVLRRHAVTDGDLVNWPPTVGTECTRAQWCHGAPGIVTTIGDLLPEDLLLGGAELTWRAGPLTKGAGLCHGTSGNGYALLRAHAITGDGVWLERARRFAMHALEQVERTRAEHARGWFTLFTGDIGTALFLRSCLDADPRFPTMDIW